MTYWRRAERSGTPFLKSSNLDSGLFRAIQSFSLTQAVGREKTGMTLVEVVFDAARSPLTYDTCGDVFVGPIGDWIRCWWLHYEQSGSWNTIHDDAFPYEFTVPLDSASEAFRFYLEGVSVDGKTMRSNEGVLHRAKE